MNYARAKEIANNNNKVWEQAEGRDVTDQMITFEFNDVTIFDPFVDESGRFDVDPISYYGSAFLNSKFTCKYYNVC